MPIDVMSVGSMQANCYILSSEQTKNAILIDPGDDYERINDFLTRKKIRPMIIVHTHGHIDHIGADNEFNLPVYVHKEDKGLLMNPKMNLSDFLSAPFKVRGEIKVVVDRDNIILDDLRLEVIHTPGHTPGGICLKSNNNIFTGDTLFMAGIGRTDFPGASFEQLVKSIREKLLVLPDDTNIYPGHGPSSTIGSEKRNNPFL